MTIKKYEKDGKGGIGKCVAAFGTDAGGLLRDWTRYDSPTGTKYLSSVLGEDFIEEFEEGHGSFWLEGSQAIVFGKQYAYDQASLLNGVERSVFEDIFHNVTDSSAVHYLWHFYW
jgi:hypothetical protein